MVGSAKKRKLDNDAQSTIERVISKLSRLNTELTTVSPALAAEFIAPLRPGIGLIGNADEEAAYYEAYLSNNQEAPTDEGAKDCSDGSAHEIDATDGRSLSSEDDDMDGEDADHDGTAGNEIVSYNPKQLSRSGGQDADEEEIGLGDLEEMFFGQDYVQSEVGEHIHVADYFGPAWVKHIVSNLHIGSPFWHTLNILFACF